MSLCKLRRYVLAEFLIKMSRGPVSEIRHHIKEA